MHPWTTPPTSWPTPPQPANPSSTWSPQSTSMASTPRPPMTWPTTALPPTSPSQPSFTIEPQQFLINPPHSSGTTPTPVEHLFGQPSALHPTWPSSTSPQQTASTMPPLSFASLATAPHAVPASHLVHTTTSSLSPDTTSLPTNLPVFATPMAPTFPTTWPTAPPPSNVPTTPPPTPLPGSPYPPRVLQSPPLATTTSTIPPAAPQFTEVKAAPKFHQARNWTNYAAQLPRLLRLHLPLHLHSQRLHLHRLSQQKWQRWALQHSSLLNLSVLFKLNSRRSLTPNAFTNNDNNFFTKIYHQSVPLLRHHHLH